MRTHVFVLTGQKDVLQSLSDAMDLTGIPYKCTWAKDLHQALEQLRYIEPDMLLVDDLYAPVLMTGESHKSTVTGIITGPGRQVQNLPGPAPIICLDPAKEAAVLAQDMTGLMQAAAGREL